MKKVVNLVKASKILEDGLRLKNNVIEKAEQQHGPKITLIKSDEHAVRQPRPCGMTIHPAYGCTLGCIYCYVKPNAKKGIELNKLSGPELVTALSFNPHFLPGKWGTFIALGSITECFLNEEVTAKTIEYIYWINKELGNPQQVSTKMIIRSEIAEKILSMGDPYLSVLISITSINMANLLEPRAPPPIERLNNAHYLNSIGLRTSVFIRPILPGVTDKENEILLRESLRFGIKELVLGSLMINTWIMSKIDKLGLPVLSNEIKSRAKSMDRSRLSPIYASDLKQAIKRAAESLGFVVYPAACAANVASHNQSCYMCDYGPCGNTSNLPEIEDEKELFEIIGVKVKEAFLTDEQKLYVKTSSPLPKHIVSLVKTSTRRRLVIKQ